MLGFLTLASPDPPNPDLRPDWPAFSLATLAAVLPFLGASLLTSPTRGYDAPWFWAPLAIAIAALLVLLVVEFKREEPLTPVHELARPLPLIGILVASLAGAVFVTAIQLLTSYATGVQHVAPCRIGVWTWPELAAVFAAATAFYFLIRTRWLAPFVLAGFVLLTVGVWLLGYLGHTGTKGLVYAATALWMAGWSTRARLVGRVFALVELIRAEADSIVAPVLRKISVTSAGSNTAAHGIRHAVAITTIISACSIAACLVVWIAGRKRFERPNLERYVEEGEPALS